MIDIYLMISTLQRNHTLSLVLLNFDQCKKPKARRNNSLDFVSTKRMKLFCIRQKKTEKNFFRFVL